MEQDKKLQKVGRLDETKQTVKKISKVREQK